MPVPNNPIRYTLCYVILDDDGAVLVDPGWDGDAGMATLVAGMRVAGIGPGDVRGIVATHVHPDHHGLSRRVLDEAPGAWIAMSSAEARSLELLRGTADERLEAERAWWAAAGTLSDDAPVEPAVVATVERFSMFERMPTPTLELADGDLLPLTSRSLRVVATPGHTPGHICLVDRDADVILTGDHLLPRISPNVGLQPTASGSPLRDYIRSLEVLTPYDHEALPGHQWQFRGVPARARELIEHHRQRLEEVLAGVRRGPVTAARLAPTLAWAHGWEGLTPFQRRAAVAETISHLVYLTEDGLLESAGDAPVVYRAVG